MAVNIPAKLKAADLTRFCVRAAQLETAKPVVAYWCEYWIANQILTRGLHNGDNETLQYTTELMDKLEQIKADNATNDAILDDIAGQAYVEQFASETFDRADRAVNANKVTKQTADTFQAAATFFELVNIWGPPDAETQAKIKYAKWNAVRIAKALKEGKDPNESNPKPQQEESMPPMGLNDLDEQQASVSDKFHHATVEELPDEQDQFNRDTAPHTSTNYSLHTPVQASSAPVPPNQEVSPRDEFPHTEDHDDSVSPIEPSQSNDRSDSVGGGFFPLPTFTAEPNDSTLPTAPPSDVNDLGLPSQPSFVPGSRIGPSFEPPPPPSEPQDYYRANPPHVQPSSTNLPHTPMPRPISQSPQNFQHHTPLQYQPPPAPYQAAVQQPPVQSGASGTNLMEVDDEAISQAQKHARWAISALNFEDTQTAIKELREALRRLGAGT